MSDQKGDSDNSVAKAYVERLFGMSASDRASERLDLPSSSSAGQQDDDDVSDAADEALDYLRKRHEAEIERLKTDNKQRKWFFKFVLGITGIPVLVASLALVRVAWDGEVSDTVLVSFFASVVVQVIGLSIIVANYLFPKTGSIREIEPGDEKA